VSGNGTSWAMCKYAPCSSHITTSAPHHSVFYRPGALPAAQPTASKHWRQVEKSCKRANKTHYPTKPNKTCWVWLFWTKQNPVYLLLNVVAVYDWNMSFICFDVCALFVFSEIQNWQKCWKVLKLCSRYSVIAFGLANRLLRLNCADLALCILPQAGS